MNTQLGLAKLGGLAIIEDRGGRGIHIALIEEIVRKFITHLVRLFYCRSTNQY